MRRPMSVLLGGLAATAALAMSAPAFAATGDFSYHVQPGNIPEVLHNPQDEQCYDVGNAGGGATNHTNRDAVLYVGTSCRGDISETIHAGAFSDHAEFRSVKFVR
ncbi:hypothetical protein ACFYY8_24795 [Streptosporangium sp. NPDC001559]|uniref:hypothetical protein n=1 Tax=Streptosporangium sp. NPDC001559 TaxID=3366187 RepID=UPI0036EE2084